MTTACIGSTPKHHSAVLSENAMASGVSVDSQARGGDAVSAHAGIMWLAVQSLSPYCNLSKADVIAFWRIMEILAVTPSCNTTLRYNAKSHVRN